MSTNILNEYQALMEAYEKNGGNIGEFANPNIPSIVIGGNKVLGKNQIKGLIIHSVPTSNGVDVKITVKSGTKVLYPMALCFGVIPKEGTQIINMETTIENNAGMNAISHCVFPNAEHIVHKMNYKINIGQNSFFRYKEIHFHGSKGGVEVIPYTKGTVGENSLFISTFTLKEGRVGKLDIKYDIDIMKKGKLELYSKVWAKEDDKVQIEEKGNLQGDEARALIKSRVVLEDEAKSKVLSVLNAYAPYSRGHVDCTEIVQDNAVAEAIPIVGVFNHLAKVTHEAAIGSIDSKELETLEARGLSKEEAVKIIVEGLLK
ncbi:MAG: SufD family Fe-S cluster assembly protein [Caldisericaceae bacterium]|nr:SufD family Fe-S cluster assembly protein [Caldisericaceae bacterium]